MPAFPQGDLGRRAFLASAGSGIAGLTALFAACGKSDPQAVRQKSGNRRKLVWVPQAAGAWDLPLRVGHTEFCHMVGWDYQSLGNPVYSVQNHLDEMNNAISARPDVIITELESVGMVSGFRRALKAKTTLVVADQALPEESAKLGLDVVNVNEFESGVMNGQRAAFWAEKISGKKSGVILIGNGNPGAYSIDQRQHGSEEGVAQYNRQHGTSFVTEAFTDGAFDDIVVGVSKYGAQMDEKGDSLAALVGLGAASAIAIMTLLKERGIGPGEKIAAGSTDASPEQLSGIEQGYLQWGIDQNLLAMGFLSAALAWLRLEHQISGWDVHTQGELVEKQDIPDARVRTSLWLTKAKELSLVTG